MSIKPDTNLCSSREIFSQKFCQMAKEKRKGENRDQSENNGYGGSPPPAPSLPCSSSNNSDDDDEQEINTKWYFECFRYYDKNGDGFLDNSEFTGLIRDICNNTPPSSSSSSPSSSAFFSSTSAKILSLLDEDNDTQLGFKETRWKTWLKSLLKPVSALIVVDVQNDFIDGSLALKQCPAGQDGASVVPVINQLLSDVHFNVEIYSLDWHDEKHISFIDNVHLRKIDPSSLVSAENAKIYDSVVFSNNAPHSQVLWPRHCVQETWGSQLHPELKVGSSSIKVLKGTNTDVDSYSAFFDNQRISQTELESVLRSQNVTDVFVCGLAYDVCVRYTILDALDLGFRTYLIEDASKGVTLEDIDKTRNKLIEKGARIINSDQVKELVNNNKPQKNCDMDIALWTANILSSAHNNLKIID